jgi:hypothetical protein
MAFSQVASKGMYRTFTTGQVEVGGTVVVGQWPPFPAVIAQNNKVLVLSQNPEITHRWCATYLLNLNTDRARTPTLKGRKCDTFLATTKLSKNKLINEVVQF